MIDKENITIKKNVQKIISAGSSIRLAGIFFLLIFFLSVIIAIYSSNVTDYNLMKYIVVSGSVISLILFFVAALLIINAGEKLMTSEVAIEAEGAKGVEFLTKSFQAGKSFQGGLIVVTDELGEHGLICSSTDLGKLKIIDAIEACHNYNSDGYTDWFFPNKQELQLIYSNLHLKGLGNFVDQGYGCSIPNDKEGICIMNFEDGSINSYMKDVPARVIAVRAF